MTTAGDYFRATVARLRPVLDSEAEDAARIIFEDVAGYDRKYIFMNGDREILDFVQRNISAAVDKVLAGEPVQYAVGRARFMGMDFKVSPAVLVPRPETEGLVDLITDDWGGRSDLSVLDLCTGSGCIAVALSRALPFSDVEAVDISADALAVARENAAALGARVRFVRADVLDLRPEEDGKFDIVVSNPPYVCESEKKDMDARVLDYEPHLALFVPDNNPLEFYRPIAEYASQALKKGGMLYFEINPLFASDIASMLNNTGFADVQIFRDYRGKQRFARAAKTAEPS